MQYHKTYHAECKTITCKIVPHLDAPAADDNGYVSAFRGWSVQETGYWRLGTGDWVQEPGYRRYIWPGRHQLVPATHVLLLRAVPGQRVYHEPDPAHSLQIDQILEKYLKQDPAWTSC